MSGLIIITIITLAVVSCLIIGLTIFSFHIILKSAKRLSSTGALDNEFKKEFEDNKKKSKRILGVISQVASGIVCLGLITLAVISGIYHASGKQFVSNNHTSFVIATNSMEGYYDDDYKSSLIAAYIEEYKVDEQVASKKIKGDQFEVGDFVEFELIKETDDLKFFDVYGYKNKKGQIITHRYVGTNTDGTLVFRGDNAPGEDISVKREQVLYHYQGHNTKYIGLVMLFFGSGYGIYSIFAVVVIYALSDVAIYKWEKIKNARLQEIGLAAPTEKKKKKNEKS